MKPKIITCTGYYCSGSSAITDFLRECSNIQCSSDYEVRFLYDPYGVSDLEYNVVTMPNRHNSSHAMKKFIYHMRFLSAVGPIKRYEKYFDNQFWSLTQKYIDSLISFCYQSRWHFDIYEKGKIYYFFHQLYSKITTKIAVSITRNKYAHLTRISKKDVAYCVRPSEEEFLELTKRYIESLMETLNKNNKEYVLCDQLLPSSNISHYMRYFDSIKVFVVDRDPRDVYIYTTHVENGTIVPKDVKKFCEWFKWTRHMTDNDRTNKNIMFVRLEDMIYKYDQMESEILSFLDIPKELHTDKKRYFIPEISAKRTMFWKQYPQFSKEIEYIEKELSEYLYDFESVGII